MPKIVSDTGIFEIQPVDIDIGRHFFDAFGNFETEVSALYIVLLCREMGGWKPFSMEQIEEVYRRAGHRDGFLFNYLLPIFVMRGEDDLYRVTDEFILRCYKASSNCGRKNG